MAWWHHSCDIPVQWWHTDIMYAPLVIKLWVGAEILQDLKDATIMTIYKNKVDKRDCNNCCGISLLSVAGKCLAKIILRCLVSNITDNILPESQCSFWSGCSTVDMIFSLIQLHEKCVEQQRSLNITFMDLTKAFDTIDRDGLWKLLPKFRCPLHHTKTICQFHKGMEGHINICGELSDQFLINNSVKQGCVLAPTQFGLFFTHFFRTPLQDWRQGSSYKWGQMADFSTLQDWEQNEKSGAS